MNGLLFDTPLWAGLRSFQGHQDSADAPRVKVSSLLISFFTSFLLLVFKVSLGI